LITGIKDYTTNFNSDGILAHSGSTVTSSSLLSMICCSKPAQKPTVQPFGCVKSLMLLWKPCQGS